MKFTGPTLQILVGFGLALFSASAFPQKTLVDQNQRTVVLPEKVERIIGITVPSASTVITLDEGTQRLVGMNPTAKRQLEDSIMRDMFPSALSIPGNMAGDGFAPNVEAILAAKPDIIFQWGDKGESILNPIEKLNIPLVTFKYGKTDYVTEWLQLTGQAIQRQDRAEKILAYFEKTKQQIEQQVAQSELKKPKVLFVFRYRSGLQVGGMGTSMHTDIERAGGVNVAAEQKGFKAINAEQLLLWNPDIILLTNFESGLTPSALLNDPLLANISAIKQQRVYQYPKGGFVWEPPSQETPLTWQWLHNLFYPQNELTNLRDEMKNYYQLLYNYALTDAEIDQVLRMDENQSSHHYVQLFRQPLQVSDAN